MYVLRRAISIRTIRWMRAPDLDKELEIPQKGRLPPVEVVLAFKHGGDQKARVAVESVDEGLRVATRLVVAPRC